MQRLAAIVSGAVYSILTIASLVGLVRATDRKHGLLATYSTFMQFHLAAQVALGAFLIYALCLNNDPLVSQYKDQLSQANSEVIELMNAYQAYRVALRQTGLIVIFCFVGAFLVQLYGSFVVSRHVSELSNEQPFAANRDTQVEANAGRGLDYNPDKPLHSATELLEKDAHHEYPDAQQQHSFGDKA